MQSRINATLKVVINGISWQRDTFITFYDPVLTGVNVVGTRDRHGPQAGGTDIRVSKIFVKMYLAEKNEHTCLSVTQDFDTQKEKNVYSCNFLYRNYSQLLWLVW